MKTISFFDIVISMSINGIQPQNTNGDTYGAIAAVCESAWKRRLTDRALLGEETSPVTALFQFHHQLKDQLMKRCGESHHV
ncbi:MAG TPA: hypothetical protein VN457_08270, partial [Chlamydiales bacterium]|nr:hypothetical protein [Chlamydiales bacterium]